MLDQELSHRIAVTRYLMIIGIVLLHLPPFSPLSAFGTTPFDTLRGMVTYGMFRATVPMLTAISGYLLFSSGIDQNFGALLSNKVKSILVPLVLWNLPLLPVLYFVQRSGASAHGFSINLYPFHLGAWADAATGIFSMPLNYPTHFLRNLFALALIAPVLGILLRRVPYVGLALVAIVYWYDLDGDFVLRNSMLVMFYLGGLAAVRKWNLRALDQAAPVLLFVFVVLSLSILVFHIQNREWFVFLSPFLVWPSMSLIAPTRFGALLHRFSKASFFTFLAHGPLLIILWLAFQKFAGHTAYPVFWFVTPLIVIPGCVALHLAFWRIAPSIAQVFLGDRGSRRPSRIGVPASVETHSFEQSDVAGIKAAAH